MNKQFQVYSVCKFNFSKIPTPYTHTKRVSSHLYLCIYSLVDGYYCLFDNSLWLSLSMCSCGQINGQWKGASAGGCGNYKDTYKNNPIYQFNLEKAGPLLIELRGSRSDRLLFYFTPPGGDQELVLLVFFTGFIIFQCFRGKLTRDSLR